MRDYTDDERRIMQAMQDTIEAAGRAVATVRQRGGSLEAEGIANYVHSQAKYGLMDYLKTLNR